MGEGSALRKSRQAEQVLNFFLEIYKIEREVQPLTAEEHRAMRQEESRPVADALHPWPALQRQKDPGGSAKAKAFDYSLKHWAALMRFIDDGALPIDNDRVENQIRPIAMACPWRRTSPSTRKHRVLPDMDRMNT
jgi:transposase